MRCPNCHGEIEDNLPTCSMCNYILDYDKVNLNRDLDEVSKKNFIIQQTILFIIKVVVLLGLIAFLSFVIFMVIFDSNSIFGPSNLVWPIIIDIICIVFLIITIKGKRRWK